jgi:Lipid membrane protein of large eukaryotic DNA viruses
MFLTRFKKVLCKMGASVSLNISRVVTRSVAKVASEIIQNSTISQNSTQIISVRNIEGDVVISGNRLTQRVQLNMSALLDALSSEIAQQNIATELAQSAKSLTSGLNLAQFAGASNTMDVLIEASIDLVSKIAQTCSSLSSQTQTLLVESVRGSVRIENNVFDQVAEIIQNCAENAVNQSQTIQDVSTKLSQTATATAEGLSAWALAVIAAVVLGIPITGGVVGGYVLLKYIFPMVLIAGVVMIILYFVYTDETMSMTAYSKFIANTPLCSGQLTNTSTMYTTALAAANACQLNANCAAFDWKGITVMPNGTFSKDAAPTTKFYSRVADACQTTIEKDPVSLVRAPVLFSGQGPPNGTVSGSQRGDVYVDLATSNWYQWTTTTFMPRGRIIVEAFTKLIVKGTAPTTLEPGANGNFYIYANPINPEYFHVFHYDDTMTEKWVQQQRVPGPGMFALAPVITNGSGFKIPQRKQWLLYSGIGALIVGAAGTAYVFLRKDDEEKYQELKTDKTI